MYTFRSCTPVALVRLPAIHPCVASFGEPSTFPVTGPTHVDSNFFSVLRYGTVIAGGVVLLRSRIGTLYSCGDGMAASAVRCAGWIAKALIRLTASVEVFCNWIFWSPSRGM